MFVCLFANGGKKWERLLSSPKNMIDTIENSLLKACENCELSKETVIKYSNELGVEVLYRYLIDNILFMLVLDPGQNPKDLQSNFDDSSKTIAELLDSTADVVKVIKSGEDKELENKITKELNALKNSAFTDKASRVIGSILIIGLDRSGKSTYIQRLKTGEFHEKMLPTLGQALVDCKIEHEGSEKIIKFLDMPGQLKLRYTWMKTIIKPNGLIYMIDLSAPERFEEARDEFFKFAEKHFDENAQDPIPQDTYMQVFLNKIDLVDDFKTKLPNLKKDILKMFKFDKYWKNFEIIPISTKTGEGIDVSIKKFIPKLLSL